jgi:hypothetical protein
VCHGLWGQSLVEAADRVWLVAETVDDHVRFEWLLAKLAVKLAALNEG